MKFFLPALLFLALCAPALSAAQLVPPGSMWKFLDDGSDQGGDWTGVNFDDLLWAYGPAQLGYGEGDEATVIGFGPNPDAKHITTYFRHTFYVADVQTINHVALGLLRDDGVVVYLNGHRMFRDNLPAGDPNFLTQAATDIEGHREDQWIWKSLDTSYLLPGVNVLAVEIHQFDGTSSDLSFDCTLDETKLLEPGHVWQYQDDGSDQGTAWSTPGFDASSWPQGPSELGYGDGDELTEIGFGGNANNVHPTTYFRTGIRVNDPLILPELNLGVKHDDGAIVYLNGIEVLRANMPAGAVDYQTYASTNIEGTAEHTWSWATINPTMLNPGYNSLAIEVHQALPDSDDVSLNVVLRPGPIEHLARAPYLQNFNENRAVVRWRTAFPESSLVEFGGAPGALTQSVFDPTPVTDHEVVLDGLASHTTYFYSVGSAEVMRAGNDVDHYFTTFPAAGQPSPTRVWVLGDCGTGGPIQMAVRDAYLAWSAGQTTDLILLLGDNAYVDGTDEQYTRSFFNVYPESLRQIPAYSTRGNHERNEGVYYNTFTLPAQGEGGGLPSGTEAYYSFDYANIHFVCLDSYATSRLVGDPMITWLENDLASTDQEWIIAFWHHPPYSKGSHDSDSIHDSDGAMVEMRERFVPVLESYGVDLVLSGHSHSYERSFLIDGHYSFSFTWDPGLMLVDSGDGREGGSGAYVKPNAARAGAIYTVAGSAGKVSLGSFDHPVMVQSLPLAGSVALDIDDDELNLSFVDATGIVADHFTLRKHREGPFLDLRNLTAGEIVTATMSGMTPGNLTYLGYSLNGPGPTTTPLGVVQLTQPIGQVGPFPADGNGELQVSQALPLALTGAVVYSQAVEVIAPGVGSMSNARADLVQ